MKPRTKRRIATLRFPKEGLNAPLFLRFDSGGSSAPVTVEW